MGLLWLPFVVVDDHDNNNHYIDSANDNVNDDGHEYDNYDNNSY